MQLKISTLFYIILRIKKELYLFPYFFLMQPSINYNPLKLFKIFFLIFWESPVLY